MYTDLINNKVVVIVSARTEALWEYTGILCEEDENSIKLKDAEITQAMLNVQKNMFGAGMAAYKQNIDEIILNKNYIVSCYKK